MAAHRMETGTMDARRDYERRVARDERTTAYRAQREAAALERFTRDDAGMRYGTDGADERTATQWLTDAGYAWDGRRKCEQCGRSANGANRWCDTCAETFGGYDIAPDSVECIDGIEAVTGDWTYDGTLTPITYHAPDYPAMMRERPDGVSPSDHNKFLWRNVDGVMRSDTLGIVNPRRATLGGRNRRDGRNLVRTALAVGIDGAVLRVLPSAADTDAAYAYALETARAMRTARLAHERYTAREAARNAPRDRTREIAARTARVDAHQLSADVTALLERSRVGTSER